jgi:glycosyltransferase involved in cell wall biosynthesis
MSEAIDLTILMPCLNEAETIARCVEKARIGIERASVRGEILVADNGSTDGSQAIAEKLGARVVPVKEKGYGSAIRGGFAAALLVLGIQTIFSSFFTSTLGLKTASRKPPVAPEHTPRATP